MLGVPRGEAGVALIPKDGGEGAWRVKKQGGLLSKQRGQHVPRQRWGGEEKCRKGVSWWGEREDQR